VGATAAWARPSRRTAGRTRVIAARAPATVAEAATPEATATVARAAATVAQAPTAVREAAAVRATRGAGLRATLRTRAPRILAAGAGRAPDRVPGVAAA